MDIRKVKKLIELLEESNIDEIEIKEGEESVRISRNAAQNLVSPVHAGYAPAPLAPPPPTPPAAPAPPPTAAPEPPPTTPQVVNSPNVGNI